MTKLLELPLNLTKNIALVLAVMFALFGLVTWIAASEAILFIAPVVSYALAGCAIIAMVVATVVFVVERSAWGRAKLAEHNRDKTLADNEAERSTIEIDRARKHMEAEEKLMNAAIAQIENGLIHPAALGEGKFSSFPAAVVKQIENAVPLLDEPRVDLLPAIANCPNILIVGGQGRGKTSLMQWLEYERMNAGNSITVLDSHAQPGQWGGYVIGAGREYESIMAAMIRLGRTLDTRHKQRNAGKDHFDTLDVFVDEFTLLPKALKGLGFSVQDYSIPTLTEGRKVDMFCVWGIHSDRAAALGLDGAMDILECFDAVVYLKKVKGDYYAKVDFGEGIEDIKYNHPGPFAIDRPTSKVKILALPARSTSQTAESIPVSNWPQPPADPEPGRPSAEEMAIIEAVKKVELDRGKIIWSAVTTELGWTTGGPNNDRIKAVLDKWKISY